MSLNVCEKREAHRKNAHHEETSGGRNVQPAPRTLDAEASPVTLLRPGRAGRARPPIARWNMPIALLILITGLMLAGPGRVMAQSKVPVRFDILVAKVSMGEGGIDPRGQELHDALKAQFRYERLEVLTTRSVTLSIDEVGRVALKNGRELLVKPLVVDSMGALVAIDISGLMQTDIKMKSDDLVVLGAESFEGGKLVVSLKPHF